MDYGKKIWMRECEYGERKENMNEGRGIWRTAKFYRNMDNGKEIWIRIGNMDKGRKIWIMKRKYG